MSDVADVRRVERQLKALEDATDGKLEGPLGELHGDLAALLLELKRAECLPLKWAVHDVPAPEGTLLERTFTGTYLGRIRRRLKLVGSQ